MKDKPVRLELESKIMTLAECAAYLNCHPSTLYRLLKKQALPGFRIGSDWKFNRESIDRWRMNQPPAIVGKP